MSALLLALLLSTPVDVPGVRAAALYTPAGHGPFPAVLLVEGWWAPGGAWEKETAERLAADGYLVLAVMPDRGDRPADRDAMHAAMVAGPPPKSLAGLNAARTWLASRNDVRRRRVAVLGARMGGRDALHMADMPRVVGVVSWYGAPPPRAPRRTPALAFFAGEDMGPTPDDARRFEKAAGGTATVVVVYPGAQHGFADRHNTWGGYAETAARDSWARAAAFLEARLKR